MNNSTLIDETPLSEQTIVVVTMLSIFSFVGLIGNAIAFYIFYRRSNTTESTFVVFILALAGIDFITCLVTIPFTVVYELLQYRLVYDIICKTYMFLITSTVPFSAYIMVGIAVDRYLCICHPLLQVFTVSRVKLVIFLLTIPAMAFGILTALSFGTASYEDAEYHVNHSYPMANESGAVLNASADVHALSTPLYGQDALSPTRSSALRLAGLNKNMTGTGGFPLTPESVSRNRPSQKFSADNRGKRDKEEAFEVVRVKTFVYHDTCTTNGVFSDSFLASYRKIHALNFMLAFIIVVILYILIYKSIITRRAEKEARRSKNFVYSPDRGAGIEDGHVTDDTDFNLKAFGGSLLPGGRNNHSPPGDKLTDPTSHVTPITMNPELTVLLEQDDALKGKEDSEKIFECPENDKPDEITLTNGAQIPNVLGTDKDEEEAQIQPEEKPLLSHSNGMTADTKCAQSPADAENNPNTTPASEAKGRSSRKFQSHNPRASKEKHKRNAAGDARDNTATTTNTSGGGYKRVSTSSSGKHKDANSVKRKRPCNNKHQMYMANIKTALMLLVVTTVFMVAFLPSLLMANQILPINLTVFYGYFIYHVANPFIYAFMNQNFRDDLKKIAASACRRK